MMGEMSYSKADIKAIREKLKDWDCATWPDDFFRLILDFTHDKVMDALWDAEEADSRD
jgi:hypothetical protein